MATIFTTDPTAKVRIDRYGVATATNGVEVPEAVAVELETTYKHRALLRIVRDEPAALPALAPLAAAPVEPEAEPAPRKPRRQE